MADQSKKKEPFKDSGLGYPKIEELVEYENFATVNKSFAEAYGKLERIMQDRSSGLKKQKGAQAAMKSYELTTALLNELLQIKYQIIKLRKEQEQKTQKK